jgi:ADP-ribose pyrophosphatase
MIKRWTREQQRELLNTPVFKVASHVATSPRTTRAHQFYVFEMPDWVNVIALPDPQTVLMIRQYRHGTDDVTLEIPGGVIDPADASPAAAAQRELLEETGWQAGRLEPIGAIAPNPALQNNRCHSYLATELTDTGHCAPDAEEEIELLAVPLVEVPELLASGAISHSLVVVAFCLYLGLSRSRTSSA